MKKLNIFLIFFIAITAFVGCGKEDLSIKEAEYGKMAFTFDKSALDARSLKAGTVYNLDNVKSAVVTIEKGSLALDNYDSKQIALNNWGDGVYTTEDIQLEVGTDYSLSKFELKDTDGTVIYATPLAGSELADKVVYPLPIAFEISKDATTAVDVEVISTEERVVAQFGYANFVVTDKTPVEVEKVGEMIDNGDGTITDSRDDKVYKTVTIGEQVWMAENLAYLPSVNRTDSISQDDPYYYVYGYSGEVVSTAIAQPNYATFGVLYNGPAALIAAPKGWHLPTEAEFKELELHLGLSADDIEEEYYWRGAHGLKLKSVDGWSDTASGDTGGGNNESGFNALPAGTFTYGLKTTKDKGIYTLFWSSTLVTYGVRKNLYSRSLRNDEFGVLGGVFSMKSGISIRLIKDKE